MKTLSTMLIAAVTLSSLLAGCQTGAITAVAPGAHAPAAEKFLTMVGHLQLNDQDGYSLMAVKTAYNLADVNHVLLTLSVSTDGGVTFTPVAGGTKTLTNAQIVANTPVSLNTLKYGRTYKIVATVSSTSDDLVANKIDNGGIEGVTTFSTAALTPGNNTTNANSTSGDAVEESYTLPTRIGCKLKDKTFAGTATSSSGVGVTNGTIANPTGSEVFN